tara:strand:+ start:803 stop:1258 length:456 start_codon:yes stop_codon:yes gene_type:complete
MNEPYYIGVDPGKSGSICAVSSDGHAWVVIKTDKPYEKIWNKLLWYGIHECEAVVESVNAMPGQGVASTFKFGESFGMLLGLMTATGIPFEKVRPAIWCKEFGLKRGEGESNTDWKNRHKQLAQELFPDIDVTHATADALLIAEYCRRKNK